MLAQSSNPSKFGRALLIEDVDAAALTLEESLRRTFEDIVIRRAANIAEATVLIESERFDLALIDLGLPDGSGEQLIRALRTHSPKCVRIVTTMYADDQHLFSALRAGAQGYLLKENSAASLTTALKGIADGQPPLSPSIARRLLGVFQQNPDEPALSPRETDCLTLIAKGYRIREVAEHLGITSNTATGYIKSVYRKLDVNSRAEATLEAARRGIIAPHQ